MSKGSRLCVLFSGSNSAQYLTGALTSTVKARAAVPTEQKGNRKQERIYLQTQPAVGAPKHPNQMDLHI